MTFEIQYLRNVPILCQFRLGGKGLKTSNLPPRAEKAVGVWKCGAELLEVAVERRCEAFEADAEVLVQAFEDRHGQGALASVTFRRRISKECLKRKHTVRELNGRLSKKLRVPAE